MEGKKDKESLMSQKKEKKSQNPTAADASLSVVTEATPSEPIWILQPYSQSPNAAAGSFPVALLGKKSRCFWYTGLYLFATAGSCPSPIKLAPEEHRD